MEFYLPLYYLQNQWLPLEAFDCSVYGVLYASYVLNACQGILGDFDQVCPIHLHPRLAEFLDIAAKQLVS